MDTITVSLVQDEDFFVSHCLEYDIASQGKSRQEALDNIKEAVSLFLEVASPDEIERRLARRPYYPPRSPRKVGGRLMPRA